MATLNVALSNAYVFGNALSNDALLHGPSRVLLGISNSGTAAVVIDAASTTTVNLRSDTLASRLITASNVDAVNIYASYFAASNFAASNVTTSNLTAPTISASNVTSSNVNVRTLVIG